MTDDLVSMQVSVVSGSRSDRDLLRQAAAASKMPIDVIETDDISAACRSVAAGVDLVYLDRALGTEAVAHVTVAARTVHKPPFTVLLSEADTDGAFPTDGLAAKPADLEDAKRLVGRSIHVRLPSRVLVLDDSPTMRSIVRKILLATRFPLELTEAGQGSEAIELARKIEFDIVFLDYNLPGLSGLETMAEFKREKRNPTFVLITSAQDDAVGARARAYGATFLKKPFFPADIEAILCSFYGLRALNPQRL